MAIAIKQNFGFGFISLFNDFLREALNNFKNKRELIRILKRADRLVNLIYTLNEKLEQYIKDDEFEKIEDKLIDMKFLLENQMDSLPKELKPSLEKLYELLVMIIFNLSMYQARD
ncbi:MAG: hypothetical protein ABGX26_07840 [Nautiliaceae bacterium]